MTKGTGAGGRPMERTWQNEFYRAATSCVPINHSVSPDVGYTYSSRGYLDYFINDTLGWGIELVRESTSAMRLEHTERFLKGGIYHSLLVSKQLKEYLVVDFRSAKPNETTLKTLGAHIWIVRYAPNFKSATVHRFGVQEHTIKFLGDDPTSEDADTPPAQDKKSESKKRKQR
jgi:hypothetical protein